MTATGCVRSSTGSADEHGGSPGLSQSIESSFASAVAVHLVVPPVRDLRLHYLTNDEAGESRDVEVRVGLAVGLFREHDVSVTGGVGNDDALESMYRFSYTPPAAPSGRRLARR